MYHFDWIKRHAERTPHKLALVDAHTGRQFTYAQFNERANRFASFLQDTLGIQRGDRVSILAQNSSDYFEVLFGCGKMGAILNTLNWRLAVAELEYIINDCAPRVLIYEPNFAEAVDTLRPQISCEFYVVIDDEAQEGEWTYEGALTASSPQGVEMPPLTYDDTWAIIYTSGTTGRPKGAQVTYGNFFYNAVGMGQAIDLTSLGLGTRWFGNPMMDDTPLKQTLNIPDEVEVVAVTPLGYHDEPPKERPVQPLEALTDFRRGDQYKLAALLRGKVALEDIVHYNGYGRRE